MTGGALHALVTGGGLRAGDRVRVCPRTAGSGDGRWRSPRRRTGRGARAAELGGQRAHRRPHRSRPGRAVRGAVGEVDVLVCNAGMTQVGDEPAVRGRRLDPSPADWESGARPNPLDRFPHGACLRSGDGRARLRPRRARLLDHRPAHRDPRARAPRRGEGRDGGADALARARAGPARRHGQRRRAGLDPHRVLQRRRRSRRARTRRREAGHAGRGRRRGRLPGRARERRTSPATRSWSTANTLQELPR